jgi:hypothetical protein
LDLLIVLAGVQPIEVRDAIDAEQHRFAIEHEPFLPQLERGFDDPRKPF